MWAAASGAVGTHCLQRCDTSLERITKTHTHTQTHRTRPSVPAHTPQGAAAKPCCISPGINRSERSTNRPALKDLPEVVAPGAEEDKRGAIPQAWTSSTAFNSPSLTLLSLFFFFYLFSFCQHDMHPLLFTPLPSLPPYSLSFSLISQV